MIDAALAFGALLLASAVMVTICSGIIWIFALPVMLHLDKKD